MEKEHIGKLKTYEQENKQISQNRWSTSSEATELMLILTRANLASFDWPVLTALFNNP
jgi:hypothetical protein